MLTPRSGLMWHGRDALGAVWHKAYSFLFEMYLGINTRGNSPSPSEEGVHYTPLPYPLIVRMLDQLELTANDVFVDVGCGKGRVVCCACRFPVKRVVALELSRVLLANAVSNTSTVRGRVARVEPVEGPAQEYHYNDATVVYLYNPFNARLTELVIDRIRASYLRWPRTIRIVYANPVHDGALQRHDWLHKYLEWPASDFPVFGSTVSFWTSDPLSKRG